MAKFLSLAIGAVAISAVLATGAAAQTPGAVVRDARGEILGRIESVVRDNTGRSVQVVVRTRTTGGARSELRALPASSLRPSGQDFTTPLRKSEFEVLPPVRR